VTGHVTDPAGRLVARSGKWKRERELPVGVVARIRAVVRGVRPVDPEFAAALARRWAELPETARTPGQTLGRHGVGCEGTHGVFPKCDLVCTPCYHSRDANQVRVDGPHTLAQVEAQLRLLRERRGPRAHAQLIGGEVSLLPRVITPRRWRSCGPSAGSR
jgi:hypothetical protein